MIIIMYIWKNEYNTYFKLFAINIIYSKFKVI